MCQRQQEVTTSNPGHHHIKFGQLLWTKNSKNLQCHLTKGQQNYSSRMTFLIHSHAQRSWNTPYQFGCAGYPKTGTCSIWLGPGNLRMHFVWQTLGTGPRGNSCWLLTTHGRAGETIRECHVKRRQVFWLVYRAAYKISYQGECQMLPTVTAPNNISSTDTQPKNPKGKFCYYFENIGKAYSWIRTYN